MNICDEIIFQRYIAGFICIFILKISFFWFSDNKNPEKPLKSKPYIYSDHVSRFAPEQEAGLDRIRVPNRLEYAIYVKYNRKSKIFF